MFHSMPFLLLVLIVFLFSCGNYIPLVLKQVLYSVSISIKSIIIFALPCIIFALLFRASARFAHQAIRLIGTILIAVCCSNFIATFISHLVGRLVYTLDLSLILPQTSETLEPLWSFTLPKILANDHAMIAGFLLGVTLTKISPQWSITLGHFLERATQRILQLLLLLIPFFIAGFVVKLQHEGSISLIVKDYTLIFVIITLAQLSYILFMYYLANGLNISKTIRSVQNMLPAALSGFSTMSSAASMPLTIVGTEKNISQKNLAHFVIPATVNIHLMGDCFAIPIFAYAILKGFGVAMPSLAHYLIFAFYFVLAKFSVAAIPGGGIIVMLPILESYLGFNADMMSLITALYVLFDPVITSMNVLGNGAFAIAIDTIVSKKASVKESACTDAV